MIVFYTFSYEICVFEKYTMSVGINIPLLRLNTVCEYIARNKSYSKLYFESYLEIGCNP